MLYDLHLEEFFAQYNEGEQIYQHYMQNQDLSVIDPTYILEHGMYIPEISGPPQLISEQVFDDADNIKIIKHACYMPPFQHSHTFFELIYVLCGYCDNQADGNCLRLETGDFCIMAPGTNHMLRVFSDSIVINILIRRSTFNETFFDLLSEKSVLSDFFWGALFEKNAVPYTVCRSRDDSVLHNAIELLIDEGARGKDNYTRKIKENLMRAIFGYMIRSHSSNFEFPSVLCSPSKSIIEILSYMQEHYTSVRLCDLAARFHYTVPYLSKRIKTETGLGFSEILNNIRIKNACALLKGTDLSVQEIALRSGFHKSDVFYKMFRKRTGISPKEYRTRNRNRSVPPRP